MNKEAFEKKIQAIEALRSAPADEAVEPLRKALRLRNNYLVSKAAAVAGALGLQPLVPDLLAAFDRFLENPVESDPQCWAKNAIIKALHDLGHSDPDVFMRGLACFQLEPGWVKPSDTATTLRSDCALALVACHLDSLAILERLTDTLGDPATVVRVNVARAISRLGRPEGTLLLRLKVLLGDAEPEVIGECFIGILAAGGVGAVPFVARFLAEGVDESILAEAAGALAQSPDPLALDTLKQCWEQVAGQELRRVILLSLAASTNPGASEVLLGVLAEGPVSLASAALTALASSRFRSDVREHIAKVVSARQDVSLQQAYQKEFGNAGRISESNT
jgi:hypothetical protein